MPSVRHLVRPDIADLEPYAPIEPFDVLAGRLGLSVDQIVKLDANENPYGPSPQALAALTNLSGTTEVAIYPDPNHTALRHALSKYTQQSPERIICGTGSDEIIDLLMRICLQPGDAIIDCPPTFGMYSFDAGVQAARVINVPRNEAFDLDLAGIAQAVEQHHAKMMFIAAPNNPTGNSISQETVERLLELPLLVIIDEAYAEFAGTSMAGMVGQYPNLVVLRTFSKWAGLAGLRIGYGLVPEALIAHLWKIKQPYNVNVAAQVAALASLEDTEHLLGTVAQIIDERIRLYDTLSALPGFSVYPSSANFLLCHIGELPTNHINGARELYEALMQRGILVRFYNKPLLRDCIRISVGTPAQNDVLLEIVHDILSIS